MGHLLTARVTAPASLPRPSGSMSLVALAAFTSATAPASLLPLRPRLSDWLTPLLLDLLDAPGRLVPALTPLLASAPLPPLFRLSGLLLPGRLVVATSPLLAAASPALLGADRPLTGGRERRSATARRALVGPVVGTSSLPLPGRLLRSLLPSAVPRPLRLLGGVSLVPLLSLLFGLPLFLPVTGLLPAVRWLLP